jgi:hypothetical protein
MIERVTTVTSMEFDLHFFERVRQEHRPEMSSNALFSVTFYYLHNYENKCTTAVIKRYEVDII